MVDRVRKSLLVALFACAGASIFPQEQTKPLPSARPIKIVLEVTSDYPGREDSLSELFRRLVLIQLSLDGLTVSISDSPDLIIRIAYLLNEERIRYSIAAEDPNNDETIFYRESEKELSPNFDKEILSTVREMSAGILAFIEADDGLEMPEKPASPAEPELETVPRTGFNWSAELGLFLPGGAAGRYLKTGSGPFFFGGYRLENGLNPGFTTGLILIKAEGFAASADGLIIPLLPSLRYTVLRSENVAVQLKSGIGPALVSFAREGGDREVKLNPTAELGLGLHYSLKKFTLGISTDIELLYEGNSLTYGFSPKIVVSL